MKAQIFSALSMPLICSSFPLETLTGNAAEITDGSQADTHVTGAKEPVHETLRRRGVISLTELCPYLLITRLKEIIYSTSNLFQTAGLNSFVKTLADLSAMLAAPTENSNETIAKGFLQTASTEVIVSLKWREGAQMAVFRNPTVLLSQEDC